LLEFVRDRVGAGCIVGKRTYNERHTPCYAYKLTSRQALALLAQIHSHLRTYRRVRAAIALDRYIALTPRNGKYKVETLRLRNEFERELLATGPGPRSKG